VSQLRGFGVRPKHYEIVLTERRAKCGISYSLFLPLLSRPSAPRTSQLTPLCLSPKGKPVPWSIPLPGAASMLNGPPLCIVQFTLTPSAAFRRWTGMVDRGGHGMHPRCRAVRQVVSPVAPHGHSYPPRDGVSVRSLPSPGRPQRAHFCRRVGRIQEGHPGSRGRPAPRRVELRTGRRYRQVGGPLGPEDPRTGVVFPGQAGSLRGMEAQGIKGDYSQSLVYALAVTTWLTKDDVTDGSGNRMTRMAWATRWLGTADSPSAWLPTRNRSRVEGDKRSEVSN
jgi:hypothetical protein